MSTSQLPVQNPAVKNSWTNLLREPVDWVLLTGLLGLSPLMVVEAEHLAERKHLQFFPIAWIFFGVLVYTRGNLHGLISRTRTTFGWILITGSITASILAALRYSPWLAHCALVALVLGWMMLRLRGNSTLLLMAWTSVLVTTIPLPMNLDTLLIQRLQLTATESASRLLDLSNTAHFVRGNILEIRTGDLFVDEACSGVDSLYALIASALMLVLGLRTSFLIAAITLILVPVWAWLGNLLRIFLIAFCLDRYTLDLSKDWPHTALGLVLFTISFAFVLATHKLLLALFEAFVAETPTTNYLHRWFNKLVAWPPTRKAPTLKAGSSSLGSQINAEKKSFRFSSLSAIIVSIVFVMIGGVSLAPSIGFESLHRDRTTLPKWPQELIATAIPETSLPSQHGSFRKVDFDIANRESSSIFGSHSAVWTYVNGEQVMQISTDFPFRGFHALEACYRLGGKDVIEPIEVREIVRDGLSMRVYQVRLEDELNQLSHLWYLNFDANGNSVTTMQSAVLGGALAPPPIAYQVQVFLPNSGEITQADREAYVAILADSAVLLLSKLRTLPGATL